MERIKQSTSGKRGYELRFFFHVGENNLVNFGRRTRK